MVCKTSSNWPVLNQYKQTDLLRIAMPLGGVGTGTISLGGRGDLRDWEVGNKPAKGFSPPHSFFALWAKRVGGESVTRCLEGAIDPIQYEGPRGCAVANHSLPRFRSCRFVAAYPLGQVLLSDPAVPVDVRLEAFNPLIPAHADDSGIPVVVLRYVLTNKTKHAVEASVCGNVRNFIGEKLSGHNVNEYRGEALHGVFMQKTNADSWDQSFGTFALATTHKTGISYRTQWENPRWSGDLLDYWDDFSDNGQLTRGDDDSDTVAHASLAVKLKLKPGESRAVTFLLTWHFPNRYNWTPKATGQSKSCCGEGAGCCDDKVDQPPADWIGNHYTTAYCDAWDVAVRTAAALPRLEKQTVQFVRTFVDSDMPQAIKESALNTLTALRSQTSFRIATGQLCGWEGCDDQGGCCEGSCTHVWNYEQATAFLFGDLACSMREVEFLHATDERGLMSFRVHLPLERGNDFATAAADGQMGCLMKLYRDWQLSGDDEFLKKLWPQAKKAMSFCWVKGGWDADQDGIMEGCQHNTYDVEFYGPNPQINTWYLGALRAAESMARHLGETTFADRCKQLFERGSQWCDEHLFNGDYYEQQIRPTPDNETVAQGLRCTADSFFDPQQPQFQLGAGCLTDQLAGQLMAHVFGLGYLLKPRHVRAALRSILKHNFRSNFHDHFNHFRSFAMGNESALLIASYPKGNRPTSPFPYCNEVMTGFEYTAATHMLYEDMNKQGLKCIAAVRKRYNGRYRNPFNEAECGHHYARAMAAWAGVLAWTGFHYSAITQTITFNATDRPTCWFWSTGYAWGEVKINRQRVELTVLHGSLKLRQLIIPGTTNYRLPRTRTLTCAQRLICET